MKTENLENELYTSLREEIKADVLGELRDEIRDIVKNEVKSILIEERGLETSLTAYIKSLCYEEVHYLKMLNKGLVKHGSDLIEIPETSKNRVWMSKKDNVDVRNLYEEYRSGGFIDCSYENFKYLMNFNPKSRPVAWNDTARKTFTYKKLFELYHTIYHFDFSNSEQLKERFLLFLADFYHFGGEFKKYKDVKKSFDKAYPSEN